MAQRGKPRPPDPGATQPSPPANVRGMALAIFVAALLVRLLHIWQLRRSPFFDVLMGDARAYDEWAQRLAGGDWLGGEVFYQAPLYPYFLGVIYAVFGRDLAIVRVCQAVVGSAACTLVGLTAWRLFSKQAAIVAGFGMALYAPAVFFDGLIQKSVLDVFFISLSMWLLSRIVTTSPIAGGRMTSFLALGLAMGALSLTRENALVLVAVVLGWIALGLRSTLRAETRPRRSSSALALVLTPVAARNYAVGGGFYLTTSQFGPNFFIGNNPRSDGTYSSLRPGRGAPEYERRDATELAERAMGRSLTPAEVSLVLDRSGARLHHRAARRLADAARAQGDAARERRRDARHRKPGVARRVVVAAAGDRLVLALRRARAAGADRGVGDVGRAAAAGDLLRPDDRLRGERRALLRIRALPVPAGAAALAFRISRAARDRSRHSLAKTR